jgi:hypothetical protein
MANPWGRLPPPIIRRINVRLEKRADAARRQDIEDQKTAYVELTSKRVAWTYRPFSRSTPRQA